MTVTSIGNGEKIGVITLFGRFNYGNRLQYYAAMQKESEFDKLSEAFINCLGSDIGFSALHLNQSIIAYALLHDNYSEAKRACSLTRYINKFRMKR